MLVNNNINSTFSNKLHDLLYLPDPKINSNPKLGVYSEKTYNIYNVEDYLNFSWKYGGSPLNDISDKFSWIENISEDHDVSLEDKLSSHYENTLLGVSTLDNNLESYLFGSTQNVDCSSWKLPESNPLKISLIPPGCDEFRFNTNWYERLQASYRNLWLFQRKDMLIDFNNEYEYLFLSELGLYYKACKNSSLELLNCLLNYNLENIPENFIEITEESYPLIYKFHSPKFKQDRLFLYDGIVFTLVVGDTSAYSKHSYAYCKRLYSNDHKGKQALCEAVYSLKRNSRFSIPITCIIDYIGFRVVAEPLMPLSQETTFFLDSLVGYETNKCDSHLITTRILSNKELANDLYKLSKYFRLCSWPLPFASSDYNDDHNFNNNCNAVEINGNLHFINTHEVLPPCLYSQLNPAYLHRFRKEFLCFYFKNSLKCSLNSQPVFNKSFDNKLFKEASDYNLFLIENNIDKFHKITSSWNLSNTIHSLGINMKNIGIIYEKTSHSSLKDVLASEMAARAFKHLWEIEIEAFLTSKRVNMHIINQTFLQMINDFLGLTIDSVSFWFQKIHPQISLHFNVIDSKSFNFRTLPQMLLITALECNMGVTIPKLSGGLKYTTKIKMEAFESTNIPNLLKIGLSENHISNFYPKVSLTSPKFNLSIFNAASRLCNHNDIYGYTFLLDSSSYGMGIPAHMKSKLLGTGYPCDPICVYNTDIVCSKFNQNVTGINLYCLSESLLLSSPIIRFKLLLTLGYSFLQHRFYNKAITIAKFLSNNVQDILPVYVESKVFELQCYCLTGDAESVNNTYEELKTILKKLEGFDGFFTLELSIIICHFLWINKEYKKCLSYINEYNSSFLHLFSVKNYEWVPTFFLSLLGYCSRELNIYYDSTKTNHELVRHCNLSNLPTFTKCNTLWLYLESLIRGGSYSQACKISSDLLSVIKVEFGDLSMEHLRALYVSAWIHRQIGAIHFVHPYLYLSNSDNIITYQEKQEWFENKDLIMEELSAANNLIFKKKHLEESLALYISLLDKFFELSRQNNSKILEIINSIDPKFCTKNLKKSVNITYQTLLKYGNEVILDSLDDPILKIYLDQSSVFQDKLILIVQHFLTLKLLSLNNNQCHAIANKLYNAYASQVSSDYTKHLSTGPMQKVNVIDGKQVYGYGSVKIRPGESFKSHITVKNNIIPRSGHDLRSIELLILGRPEYDKNQICEMCIQNCNTGRECETWFYYVFDFINPKCDLTSDKFTLSLDILRVFSTSCLSLFILGHAANISNSDLNQTLSFKSFKKNMYNSKKNKTI